MEKIDVLLSAMRLAGGVILDCELRGEWAIHSSFPAPICSQFLSSPRLPDQLSFRS